MHVWGIVKGTNVLVVRSIGYLREENLRKARMSGYTYTLPDDPRPSFARDLSRELISNKIAHCINRLSLDRITYIADNGAKASRRPL